MLLRLFPVLPTNLINKKLGIGGIVRKQVLMQIFVVRYLTPVQIHTTFHSGFRNPSKMFTVHQMFPPVTLSTVTDFVYQPLSSSWEIREKVQLSKLPGNVVCTIPSYFLSQAMLGLLTY